MKDFLTADSRSFLGVCLGEICKDDLQPVFYAVLPSVVRWAGLGMKDCGKSMKRWGEFMSEGCSDGMFNSAHRSVSEDQPPNNLHVPSWYISFKSSACLCDVYGSQNSKACC